MEGSGRIFGAFNPTALKEPRGFIKVIQWILSIFAFATTTSVHSRLEFVITCTSNTTTGQPSTTVPINVGYPFDLDNEGFSVFTCNQTVSKNLMSGAKPSAEFYVFVGVIVFLYCLAALIMYVFCDEFYRKHNACTIGDFIISCVLVVLWLISSSAWASGLSDIKYYTDLNDCDFFKDIPVCHSGVGTCSQTMSPNFASLNVSIIFGFLNMLVWGGNLWFLYKETPWHKVQSKLPAMPGQPAGPTETTGRI